MPMRLRGDRGATVGVRKGTDHLDTPGAPHVAMPLWWRGASLARAGPSGVHGKGRCRDLSCRMRWQRIGCRARVGCQRRGHHPRTRRPDRASLPASALRGRLDSKDPSRPESHGCIIEVGGRRITRRLSKSEKTAQQHLVSWTQKGRNP